MRVLHPRAAAGAGPVPSSRPECRDKCRDTFLKGARLQLLAWLVVASSQGPKGRACGRGRQAAPPPSVATLVATLFDVSILYVVRCVVPRVPRHVHAIAAFTIRGNFPARPPGSDAGALGP